jgi:predicted RNA-binding Zn-ribbon protein involved in translation (DUF1610 family)
MGFSVAVEPKKYVFCTNCNNQIHPEEKHLKFIGSAKYYSVSKRLCRECLEAILFIIRR